MRILFITSRINPFKPTQGASQRSNLLLRACCEFAEVDVISFCTNSELSDGGYTIVYQENIETKTKENRWMKGRKLLTPWDVNSFFTIDQSNGSIYYQQF